MQQKLAQRGNKTTEVPLAKLKPGRINVRATDRDEGLDELVASIRSKGLLQPLVARTGKGGTYEVTAGNRRLRALERLAAAGDWKGSVPVILREETDAEARDTSLAENVVRVPMHPVDQYEAFAGLDLRAADIAARYGVTEASVRQRLALGNLHPDVRSAWRAGKIDAETARSFTLSRDTKRQAQVLADLAEKGQLYKHAVRRAFVADRPRTDDARVGLVGLANYRVAGGHVDEDLFSEHGYVCDVELLDRLVAERLEEICRDLVRDGWSFAVVGNDPDGNWRWRSEKPAGEGKATPAEAKRLKAINAALEKLEDADEDADAWRKREALEAEADELTKLVAARGYAPEQKARLGCRVELNTDGLRIFRGVKSDAEAGRKSAGPPDVVAADDVKTDPKDPTAIPLALLADLGALQSQVVAQCLEVVPSVAVQIAAAALRSCYDSYRCGNSPVRLTADGLDRRRPGIDDGDEDGEEDAAGVRSSGFAAAMAVIPVDDAPLALARELARAVDCRHLKFKPIAAMDLEALLRHLPQLVYTQKIAASLSLQDYFDRAPATVAVAALEEMGETPLKNARKSVLVERAVELGRAKGWIPPALRHPAWQLGGAAKTPSAAPAKGKGKGTAKTRGGRP